MSALLSMAQQFSGLPVKSLIAAPLDSAAVANGNMARTQTQFMLETCFKKGANDNLEPIMISFELKRSVIDAEGKPLPEPVTLQFTLPLLTIIPLNSLAVETVDVTFEMEVKSSMSKETSQTDSKAVSAKAEFKAEGRIGPFSVSMSASASYDSKSESSSKEHYKAENSAKYTISVHAGQLPLPKGVTTIIDAFAKNIAPIQLEPEADAAPSQ